MQDWNEPDCLSGAPYTPDAVELEIIRDANTRAPKCSNGHATNYSHGVGAYRCEFGAIVRQNGSIVRGC